MKDNQEKVGQDRNYSSPRNPKLPRDSMEQQYPKNTIDQRNLSLISPIYDKETFQMEKEEKNHETTNAGRNWPFFHKRVSVISGWMFSLVTLIILTRSTTLAQGPVIDVHAVAHKKATLPCDIIPPVHSDSTILVLWYKDLGDMPIYSYDARTQPGSHAKNEILLAKRAYFRTVTEPASLSIDSVTEADQGIYRCRVDFLKSPTRNSKVNLTVIVPPQKPTIFDDTGRDIGGIAGPYTEGSTMSLTCIASGGRPPPKLTWWRGGSLLDDSYKVINYDGAVQNKLEVLGLTRIDLHAVFTCQASNNNMSDPVITSVQVEMYFLPLQATILGSNQPVSALREIEIACQSVGSRPPANITWFKDGQYIEATRQEESPTGNVSTSVLLFTPRVSDHGKTLTCRAQNPRLDASAEEDSWKLAVFFVPILNLAFGSNIDPDSVREDTDLYFECKIHANPWVYKVVWLHNGLAVQHNTSAGIIMTNQSLVLQKLKRSSAGTYVCKASNIEGEGTSNAVELNVMYKPICRSDQKRVYGVAKGEQVEIECKVDSNPKADSFKWAFNNSAESIDVPQARFSNVNSARLTSSSLLRYTPYNELDYGSVICYAQNDVGHQIEPCVFHIIGAGKPDAPVNCSVQNITTESLEIDCFEGFDGGLPQIFHAEVVDSGSPRLIHNLTSPIPMFVITGLRSGQHLRLYIYASNRKGISEKIRLEEQTVHEAEKRTAASQTEFFELTPFLGVCVGIVCGLLVVALGILLALKFRKDNHHSHHRSPTLKSTKTEYRVEVGDEDKNPDIIPSSKDSDYYYNEGLMNGPNRNGNITENFRNCTYYSDTSNAEITYAELCHDTATGTSGSSGWSSGGGGGGGTLDRKRRRSPNDDYPSEPTAGSSVVYATIDHGGSRARLNTDPPVHPQSHHHHHHHHQQQHHLLLPPHQREIVSVRTPLLVNPQQESCV